MSDLIQYVEYAHRNGLDREDPFAWRAEDPHLVPATNRRRILDREHAQGRTPDPDGWLTFGRDLGTLYGTHIWHWTRIRWETVPRLETQELP